MEVDCEGDTIRTRTRASGGFALQYLYVEESSVSLLSIDLCMRVFLE